MYTISLAYKIIVLLLIIVLVIYLIIDFCLSEHLGPEGDIKPEGGYVYNCYGLFSFYIVQVRDGKYRVYLNDSTTPIPHKVHIHKNRNNDIYFTLKARNDFEVEMKLIDIYQDCL